LHRNLSTCQFDHHIETLPLGVKKLGRETNHSHPFGADVKNASKLTFTHLSSGCYALIYININLTTKPKTGGQKSPTK
jgi:hypothetical protein